MKIKKKEEEEENLGKKGCRVVREVTQTLRWREENVEKWNCQPTHTHKHTYMYTLMEFHELACKRDARRHGNIGHERWAKAWMVGSVVRYCVR